MQNDLQSARNWLNAPGAGALAGIGGYGPIQANAAPRGHVSISYYEGGVSHEIRGGLSAGRAKRLIDTLGELSREQEAEEADARAVEQRVMREKQEEYLRALQTGSDPSA